jgi:hypothetical protein
MADNPHHAHLLRELTDQLAPVFSGSPQGIYLYLDDTHKACNHQFAELLGYASPEEWVNNPYAVGDLDKADQKKVIAAYMDASEKFKSSTLTATWVRKDGRKVKTLVTMVPLSYQDEVFVLHFVMPQS